MRTDRSKVALTRRCFSADARNQNDGNRPMRPAILVTAGLLTMPVANSGACSISEWIRAFKLKLDDNSELRYSADERI